MKATGLVLERHPRLNRHVFHRGFRRLEATFDEVSCTLVIRREGPNGEEVLFPVLIRTPDRLSIPEIHRVIRHHRERHGAIPQMAAIRRIQRMSWLGRKYFSYKARSDPRFYARYYGSYGLSVNVSRDWGPVAAEEWPTPPSRSCRASSGTCRGSSPGRSARDGSSASA